MLKERKSELLLTFCLSKKVHSYTIKFEKQDWN